jgi:hypothetical protein
MAPDEQQRDDQEPAEDTALPTFPPPMEPRGNTNPALSEAPKDAYTGRSDQDVTKNTGAGAGGATEYGGGNKNHPSRIAGKPPGS